MSNQTVIINIGGGNLTPERWRDFKRTLSYGLRYEPSTVVYTEAEGTGYWEGETEPSYVVVAEMEPETVRAVRIWLVDLARRFNQDAIAMTVGTVDLITQEEG